MTPTRLGIRTPTGVDTADVIRDIGNANADIDALVARMLGSIVQPGRLGDTDFKVTAGAGMTVSVAAGIYFVKDDGLTWTELVPVFRTAATVVNIAASNGSLPRIDQIVANTDGSLAVLTGTATSGATLDNRLGTLALGNDQERIADLLVPAASASVTNPNIRDRRMWANGALAWRILAGGGSSLTTASATPAVMSTSILSLRLELGGGPIRYKLRGRFLNAAAGNSVVIDPRVDGVASPIAGEPGATMWTFYPGAPGGGTYTELESVYTPAARNDGAGQTSDASGSHLIQPWWSSPGATTATLTGSTSDHAQLEIEEEIRPNANNGIL